jgi:hypothetical protein
MMHTSFYHSRCLAMDGRSDSDIPAFGCTPQYYYRLFYVTVYALVNKELCKGNANRMQLMEICNDFNIRSICFKLINF